MHGYMYIKLCNVQVHLQCNISTLRLLTKFILTNNKIHPSVYSPCTAVLAVLQMATSCSYYKHGTVLCTYVHSHVLCVIQ